MLVHYYTSKTERGKKMEERCLYVLIIKKNRGSHRLNENVGGEIKWIKK